MLDREWSGQDDLDVPMSRTRRCQAKTLTMLTLEVDGSGPKNGLEVKLPMSVSRYDFAELALHS